MVHNSTSMMRLVGQNMREYGIALHGTGSTVVEARNNIGKAYKFPQILYMSCGHKQRIEKLEDISFQNIACPCGNPNHWIVKYDLLLPITPSRREKLKNFFLRLLHLKGE